MRQQLVAGVSLVVLLSLNAGAQDARTAIDAASKAMGAAGINAMTYAGSAATGNFGQSKTIAGPLATTMIANYTRHDSI